ASDPEGAKLLSALGCHATSFAVMGEWLAARCGTDGAVARMQRGGAPELLRALPKADYLADDIFFTQTGDLVIELSLRARRYVVWKLGQPSHGPERRLSAEREVMAQTSPTLLVR